MHCQYSPPCESLLSVRWTPIASSKAEPALGPRGSSSNQLLCIKLLRMPRYKSGEHGYLLEFLLVPLNLLLILPTQLAYYRPWQVNPARL